MVILLSDRYMVPTEVSSSLSTLSIFICIDAHGRASDIEFVIDVEGISYSRDFIGSTCDVEVSLALIPLFFGINVERT